MARGDKRPLFDPSRSDNCAFRASVHNKFKMEVVDGKTGKVKDVRKAENVICNGWWDLSSIPSYLILGFGDDSPSSSDTIMTKYIAGKYMDSSWVEDSSNWANGEISWTASWTFSETEANPPYSITREGTTYTGNQIKEVGLSSGSGQNAALATHALFTTMNGVSGPITKTDTDILVFHATVYMTFLPQGYPLSNGSSSHITKIPTSMLVNKYPDANSHPYDRIIFARGWNSNSRFETLKTLASVTRPTSKSTSVVASRLAYDQNNDGGFNKLALYQDLSGSSSDLAFILFKPPGRYTIEKENVGTGDGSNRFFSTEIDFPYSASVYINNSLTPADHVHVYKKPHNGRNLGLYFDAVRADSTPSNIMYVSKLVSAPNNGTAPSDVIFFNPFYDDGVGEIRCRKNSSSLSSSVKATNDPVTDGWHDILLPTTTETTYSIAEADKYYKFWWFDNVYVAHIKSPQMLLAGDYNVVFDEGYAPADGDAIYVSYTTDFVPKNEHSVFDFSLIYTVDGVS